MRLDEHATFHMIEVGGEQPTGHFTLARGVGDLAYASTLFVIEHDGYGRVWPLAAVTCLYSNDRDHAPPRRHRGA